ncbi:MAG: hypothetical protein R3A45_11745 [Bdellovibrionota bacterium]
MGIFPKSDYIIDHAMAAIIIFINGWVSGMELISPKLIILVLGAIWICFTQTNSSNKQWEKFTKLHAIILGIIAAVCILLMNYSSKFLYFQF